jgi:hypothetical protein
MLSGVAFPNLTEIITGYMKKTNSCCPQPTSLLHKLPANKFVLAVAEKSNFPLDTIRNVS